jgi:PleD family two-component response regulator
MAIDDTNVTLVSLSIGVVSARRGEDYEALVQRADKARYEAKTSGRNAIKAAA